MNIFRGLLFFACLITGAVAFFTWDTSYIANDGVQYLSTASNWLNGDDFSTSALIYTPHFQGQIPALQTVWPPGYPFSIAITTLTGLDLHTSALVLNQLGHALAGVLVFLIMKNLTAARGFAVTAASLFYLTAVSWHYTLGLLAEPIFTVLTLAIIVLLSKPLHGHWLRYLFCGLLAAAAVYTRYAAIFFAFSVSLAYLVIILTHERHSSRLIASSLANLTLVSLPPVLAMVQLLLRNQHLTGNIQRETGFDSPDSLANTLKLWIGHSADVLGFSAGGIFSHAVGRVLYVVLLVIIVFISLYAIRSVAKSSRLPLSVLLPLSIILVHGMTFIMYLSYCNLTDSPLRITTRYVYQIYPGLFILFCYLLWTGFTAVRMNRHSRGLLPLRSATATLIGVFLIAQINEASAPPRFNFKAKFVQSSMALAVTDTMDLGTFIERCFADAEESSETTATIWSTHGQQVYLNTGIPTLTRTEIYANEALDFNALEKQIAQYNIRLFIFFDEIDNPGEEHVTAMHSIMEWLPKNGHFPIVMRENTDLHNIAVYIYTVNDQCRQLL